MEHLTFIYHTDAKNVGKKVPAIAVSGEERNGESTDAKEQQKCITHERERDEDKKEGDEYQKEYDENNDGDEEECDEEEDESDEDEEELDEDEEELHEDEEELYEYGVEYDEGKEEFEKGKEEYGEYQEECQDEEENINENGEEIDEKRARTVSESNLSLDTNDNQDRLSEKTDQSWILVDDGDVISKYNIRREKYIKEKIHVPKKFTVIQLI